MACSRSSITSFKFVLSTCLTLLLISYSLKRGHALEEIPAAESNFHSVHISSLLPSFICKPSSSTGLSGKSTLKIVDRNSPCHEGESNKLTLAEILDQDQSRVASIQARHASSSITNRISVEETTIPAKSGASLGSGNYVVTVGLGTPTENYNLIFDTGSDLTWMQCQPCLRSCYSQNDPIYDPSQSSTYSNISCDSAQCALLVEGTGQTPGCLGSTCVYGIQYGDQSFSVGYFAQETLTLATDVFPDYLFGCGQYNQGTFGEVDGLLGLGRSAISVVSQTSQTYAQVFSYCLPSSSESNGYLSFGEGMYPNTVKFTPFSISNSNNNFYFVDIVVISVGPLVFEIAGIIVDSGTLVTRLPPTAYSELRSAFKQQMAMYKTVPPFSILDTCFDFSNQTTITVPNISFLFRGNANIDLGISNTLVAVSASQVCLAFAGNSADTDLGILGNIQQKTMQLVYDVPGGRLGFGAGGRS